MLLEYRLECACSDSDRLKVAEELSAAKKICNDNVLYTHVEVNAQQRSARVRIINARPSCTRPWLSRFNRFKALAIGGGGLFVTRHAPRYVGSFAEGLTLPIVILGVGANRWVTATGRRALTEYVLSTRYTIPAYGMNRTPRSSAVILLVGSLHNTATHTPFFIEWPTLCENLPRCITLRIFLSA